MEDDWGLEAVVRGCFSADTRRTKTTKILFPIVDSPPAQQSLKLFPISDLSGTDYKTCELNDLYQPFFHKFHQNLAPSSVESKPIDLRVPVQDHPKKSNSGSVTRNATTTKSNPQISRPKRRKNQLKKVCQVRVEALGSDIWAWRKYGQKPIKGSPYPRGYYRCSSSKGCTARKQVERNRSDPGMFIVTYTGEHSHSVPTHRSSLAGSTRPKHTSPRKFNAGDTNNVSSSKTVSRSPTPSIDEELTMMTESREDKDFMEGIEEYEFDISNFDLNDDFFAGLEEYNTVEDNTNKDRFSDRLPAVSFGNPWRNNNNTATAAGSV